MIGKMVVQYFLKRRTSFMNNKLIEYKTPKELSNISFPECSNTCACMMELEVGECETVCKDKFREGKF